MTTPTIPDGWPRRLNGVSWFARLTVMAIPSLLLLLSAAIIDASKIWGGLMSKFYGRAWRQIRTGTKDAEK